MRDEDVYALIERSRFISAEGARLILRYLLAQMMDDPGSRFWRLFNEAINKLQFRGWQG